MKIALLCAVIVLGLIVLVSVITRFAPILLVLAIIALLVVHYWDREI